MVGGEPEKAPLSPVEDRGWRAAPCLFSVIRVEMGRVRPVWRAAVPPRKEKNNGDAKGACDAPGGSG